MAGSETDGKVICNHIHSVSSNGQVWDLSPVCPSSQKLLEEFNWVIIIRKMAFIYLFNIKKLV